MSVYTNPPEWEAQGKKPPSSKRTEGWKPGDRVPASWLNWFWFSTVNSLREIAQAFVSHRDSTSGIHGATSSATANRLIIRDSNGRAKVAAPSASDDIATKGYVDSRIPASPTLPAGVIVMWSGSVSSIPSGWALCDGRNGTPDLRDRFIVGAGGSYNVGDTGGSNTVRLTTSQIPSHSHTVGSAGKHSHEGVTDYWARDQWIYVARETRSTGGVTYEGLASPLWTSLGHRHTFTTDTVPDHTHSVGNTGGGQAHENRPPYYALCFIMKL